MLLLLQLGLLFTPQLQLGPHLHSLGIGSLLACGSSCTQGSDATGAEGLGPPQDLIQALAGRKASEPNLEQPGSSCACRNDAKGLAGMLSRQARSVSLCWHAA